MSFQIGVNAMKIEKIHHVAYRCRDAAETVAFYKRALDMDLVLAISEDHVPSTKAPDPYMHIFLDAGAGNVLAFFELPNSPAMDRDRNTPDWVQHIALKVADTPALAEAKAHLESLGVEVIGPVNHEIFQSIYFFDPNGHRLELAADTVSAETLKQLNEVAPAMIAEWAATRSVVRHAAWLHEKEFA